MAVKPKCYFSSVRTTLKLLCQGSAVQVLSKCTSVPIISIRIKGTYYANGYFETADFLCTYVQKCSVQIEIEKLFPASQKTKQIEKN